MRDTQRERQKHRQREKQAPCGEPDAGLDPGTLGSHPEPKAGTQPLSHPGAPVCHSFNSQIISIVWIIPHFLFLFID